MGRLTFVYGAFFALFFGVFDGCEAADRCELLRMTWLKSAESFVTNNFNILEIQDKCLYNYRDLSIFGKDNRGSDPECGSNRQTEIDSRKAIIIDETRMALITQYSQVYDHDCIITNYPSPGERLMLMDEAEHKKKAASGGHVSSNIHTTHLLQTEKAILGIVLDRSKKGTYNVTFAIDYNNPSCRNLKDPDSYLNDQNTELQVNSFYDKLMSFKAFLGDQKFTLFNEVAMVWSSNGLDVQFYLEEGCSEKLHFDRRLMLAPKITLVDVGEDEHFGDSDQFDSQEFQEHRLRRRKLFMVKERVTEMEPPSDEEEEEEETFLESTSGQVVISAATFIVVFMLHSCAAVAGWFFAHRRGT